MRRVIRRSIDIAGASVALLLSAPVLALAAIAIRIESRGPVIYRQRRIGLHGRPFDALKLRTMVQGAEHLGAGLAVNANDARITRVGALLRRQALESRWVLGSMALAFFGLSILTTWLTWRFERLIDPLHFEGVVGFRSKAAVLAEPAGDIAAPELLRPLLEYERLVGGRW